MNISNFKIFFRGLYTPTLLSNGRAEGKEGWKRREECMGWEGTEWDEGREELRGERRG